MGRSVVTGSYPASVAVGDFNRDAKSDLVTGNLNAGTVSVLLGNGDGTFLPKHDFDAGTNPYSVVVGDFDLDGNPDVAVVNLGPNTAVAMIGGGEVDEIAGTNAVFGFLSVLHGNGDGTFAAPTTWPTVRDPSAVVVTDMNGDGKPDLAVTSSSTSAGWIAGNGDGTFALPSGLSSLAAYSVATGDADADGNADLATANFSSNSMSVLRGLGGGLVDTRTYPVGRNPFSVAIGDLDGDGKPDVATANIGSGTSTVLLGNGDGTFGARTELPMGGEPRAVRIGNLGSDAGPALMVANSLANTVSVLLGLGTGTVGARTDFGVENNPFAMAIGDLDGDGRPDLAVANATSNTLSLLFQRQAPLAMGVTLDPQTFNLRAMGHWVTAYLEPPALFTADQIDVSSIRLNGQVSVDPTAPVAIGDHNGNGVPDLMVKFDRGAVELTLSEGAAVPVTVTGTVDGHAFSGTAMIRVIRVAVTAPAAGTTASAGSVVPVRWEPLSGVDIQSVALLSSFDDGTSWTLVARDLPNTGACDWVVRNPSTERARLAIVLVESSDASGDLVNGVLGVSGKFTINGTTGVEPGTRLELALHGVSPNPARSAFNVHFSLPNARPATLSLYDVSGRQVLSREVGAFGPGSHELALLPASRIPAGVYVIRLTQEGRSFTTRAAFIR